MERKMNEKTKISRRRFLALSGGAIGATVLTCGGLAAMGGRQPAVEFVESSCGKEQDMGDKVLVTYASRCGSTGEVAQAIGQVLCAAGAAVDVRQVENVSDLGPYRAVVLGSAVRSSRCLPEAVEFAKTHQDALNRVKVAYFLTCLMLAVADTEETRREAAAFLDPLREQLPRVQPLGLGLFAGVLDFSKLPFLYRFVWPLTAGRQASEGDYRDWEAIRAWAGDLHPKLLVA
jgi:menaquinone-dependent protoporphyrinogen oxidase